MRKRRPPTIGFAPGAVSRRDFIVGATASTLLMTMHDAMAGAASTILRSPGADSDERIVALRLRTAAPLDRMKAFYRDALEMKVLGETERELTVAAGETTITFVAVDHEGEAPFYHFAFNIPEQKILAARAWQLERTPVFQTPENLRDPAYPNDVRHFRSWNAHSVFFFDPAENVLEYIARHDLPTTRVRGTAGARFGPDDVLYASEIALVVDDVPGTAARLGSRFDLPQYRGGSDQFHAMGDERGLLLVFATGRELGPGSGKSKACGVFPTEATLRTSHAGTHEVEGYPYRIATSRGVESP